jgi:hypothetical protein
MCPVELLLEIGVPLLEGVDRIHEPVVARVPLPMGEVFSEASRDTRDKENGEESDHESRYEVVWFHACPCDAGRIKPGACNCYLILCNIYITNSGQKPGPVPIGDEQKR